MLRFTGRCAFHTRSAVRTSYQVAPIWKTSLPTWLRQISTSRPLAAVTKHASWQTPDDLSTQDAAMQKAASSTKEPLDSPEFTLDSVYGLQPDSWKTPDDLPSQDTPTHEAASSIKEPLDESEFVLHTEAGAVKLQASWNTPDGLPDYQASWQTPDDLATAATQKADSSVKEPLDSPEFTLDSVYGLEPESWKTPDDLPSQNAFQPSWQIPDDLSTQDAAAQKAASSVKEPLDNPEFTLDSVYGLQPDSWKTPDDLPCHQPSWRTPDDLPAQDAAAQEAASSIKEPLDESEFLLHTEAGSVKLQASWNTPDGLPDYQASWQTPDDLSTHDASSQKAASSVKEPLDSPEFTLDSVYGLEPDSWKTPDDLPSQNAFQPSWATPDDLPSQDAATKKAGSNIKEP